jgi:hypothetical protein
VLQKRFLTSVVMVFLLFGARHYRGGMSFYSKYRAQ